MRIAIAGPNLRDQSEGTFHVHAADCADLLRGVRREPEYANAHIMDAETDVDVCDAMYPPADFECESGEYLYDFKFFPCCSDLPTR